MTLFNEMGLSSEIQWRLKKLGFEQPTPIQEKVVPFLLEEKQDMVALAQTGTGKTAAFGLPIIQQIEISIKDHPNFNFKSNPRTGSANCK